MLMKECVSEKKFTIELITILFLIFNIKHVYPVYKF